MCIRTSIAISALLAEAVSEVVALRKKRKVVRGPAYGYIGTHGSGREFRLTGTSVVLQILNSLLDVFGCSPVAVAFPYRI